jgi:uncharacterized integral membrane protein (TIGR00698 family)
MSSRLLELLPGVALCAALTGAIIWARPLLPEVFGEALLAVSVGLVVGNLVAPPAATKPGLRWMSRTGLRLAIVLMGARLAFADIVQGGVAALLLLLCTMTVAALVVVGLGRWMAVPRRLTTLLAVGTAVCGNSAIIATAPLIEAEEREVAFAVGTITLFGTLAVFAFPFLGHALGLPQWHYGVWAGAAINDTAQVLAAGLAYGDSAAAVATVVKLTRNALMAPILVGVGVGMARHRPGVSWQAAVGKSIPLFVVGFLAVALLNTLGVLPATLRSALIQASRLLILAALAGIGLSLRLLELRVVGWRPFLVGLGASVGLAAATLLLTSATQGIWQRVFGAF